MAGESLWERPKAMRWMPMVIAGLGVFAQLMALWSIRSGGLSHFQPSGQEVPPERMAEYTHASTQSAWLALAFALACLFTMYRTSRVHTRAAWLIPATLFGLWGLLSAIGWAVPQYIAGEQARYAPWRILHTEGPPFWLPLMISFGLFRAIRQRIWAHEFAGVISQFD